MNNSKKIAAYKSFLYTFYYAAIFFDLKHPIRTITSWPDYWADSFKLRKTKISVCHLKNGNSYKVRPGTLDRVIIAETNLSKHYNPPGFEIGQSDIVVDIGAQIGTFAILAAKLAKKGKVIALEPEKSNFSLFRENIKLNNVTNILPLNQAVSNKTGQELLHLSADNTGGHSLLTNAAPNRQKGSQPVKTTTLSNIIKSNKLKRINFLKIDIERGEYDIILNLNDSILKKIDKISMEFHQIDRKRNGSVLKHFLQDHNFEVKMQQQPDIPIGMLYAKRAKN